MEGKDCTWFVFSMSIICGACEAQRTGGLEGRGRERVVNDEAGRLITL